MTGVEYKVESAHFKEAPKGRVPYMKIDGQMVYDSSLIVRRLKETLGDPLDSKLSRVEKARALAMQRMIEDHLYFASAWLRWSDEESWKYVSAYFIALLPPFLGRYIVKIIRKDMFKMAEAHGMGQHTRQDVIDFAKADLEALSDLLGEKEFFLGDQPTSLDATMYGFLVNLIWVPWNSPLKEYGLSLENLVRFCERMKKRYW
jgi:glutathione S-transferase